MAAMSPVSEPTDDRLAGIWYPVTEVVNFYLHHVYDGARAHPEFYLVEPKVSFLQIRRWEREAELRLPCNAEVNFIFSHLIRLDDTVFRQRITLRLSKFWL
jgi:hypothetical protein